MRIGEIGMLLILTFACIFSVFACDKTVQSDEGEELLLKHDWTIVDRLAEHQLVLPTSFENPPGEFPIPIYWAINNELSKSIGLDIEPYLGEKVVATVYELKEGLPLFLYPYRKARGILISIGIEIIGAWIQGPYTAACSLDRKSFDQLTGSNWGEWLVDTGIVNLSNELEKKLAAMTPEQVIVTYYDAIAEQNYGLAYACFSRRKATYFLFSNLGDSDLFHKSYTEASGWIENIEAIEVKSIEPFEPGMEVGVREYAVIVETKYKQESPLQTSGRETWFITLRNEIKGMGWRIHGIGTGP